MNKERGKIRGFFFEIDGDQETLQEGLKSFGAALGRALSGPAQAPRPLPGKLPNGQFTELPVDETTVQNDDLDSDFPQSETGSPKKKAPRRAAPLPKVLDVDIKGKDGVSLKDFAEQKKPASFYDRFLCAAAWFKDHGKIDEVTADHVFTAYKIVGWTPHPSSYYTVLSDLKNKAKTLDKGSSPGSYKINLAGINAVNNLGSK
jgi:hypothetical protein